MQKTKRMIFKVWIIIVIFWETAPCKTPSWKLYAIVKQLRGVGTAISITDKRKDPEHLIKLQKANSEVYAVRTKLRQPDYKIHSLSPVPCIRQRDIIFEYLFSYDHKSLEEDFLILSVYTDRFCNKHIQFPILSPCYPIFKWQGRCHLGYSP